jgi:hypothetical protein
MGAQKDFAVEGGLQAHSVGDTYPYTVQAYENPKLGTRYVIFDSSKGLYQGYSLKDESGNITSRFFEWSKAQPAQEVLEHRFKNGMNIPLFLTNYTYVVWLPFSPLHFHN